MTWLVGRKLKSLRATTDPSPAFQAALCARLAAEAGVPIRLRGYRFAAAGICSLVLVLGSATGVYAYQSPTVVEGHPLYGIKRQLEAVQEKMAVTPEAEAEYHVRMLQRRMTEAERLPQTDARERRLEQAAKTELDASANEVERAPKDAGRRDDLARRVGIERDRYQKLTKRVREDR